jgi:hypothetical protein
MQATNSLCALRLANLKLAAIQTLLRLQESVEGDAFISEEVGFVPLVRLVITM